SAQIEDTYRCGGCAALAVGAPTFAHAQIVRERVGITGSAAADRDAQREVSGDVLVDGAAGDDRVARLRSIEVERVAQQVRAADDLEDWRQVVADREARLDRL